MESGDHGDPMTHVPQLAEMVPNQEPVRVTTRNHSVAAVTVLVILLNQLAATMEHVQVMEIYWNNFSTYQNEEYNERIRMKHTRLFSNYDHFYVPQMTMEEKIQRVQVVSIPVINVKSLLTQILVNRTKGFKRVVRQHVIYAVSQKDIPLH